MALLLQPFLPDLDLILGAEEKVMITGGTKSLQRALEKIRECSKATVVLKRGEKGCEVYVPGSEMPISTRSFPIEVLNILGAGDAFASGFLRGCLRDEPLETCALWGNANGALTVTRHGCSPSMASFPELQYFIEHFDRDPNILESPALLGLHQSTLLGQPRSQPLLVLAFDHLTKFEESCKEHRVPESRIHEFKELVFQGFRQVAESSPDQPLALLVDPEYGPGILQDSAYATYGVGVPIEKANPFPLKWLCGDELYQHLRGLPSQWFVKVLWCFHPNLPPDQKLIQMRRLTHLHTVCKKLDRRLILDLIIPNQQSKNHADYSFTSQGGEAVVVAISEVYGAQVYPFWWKITAPDSELDWCHVTKTLDSHDPEVGVIISGKNTPGEYFKKWLRIVRSSPHACGFEIGRSIYWEPWETYASETLDPSGIPATIALRYKHEIDLWLAAATHE